MDAGMTQTEAANVRDITQARVWDIKGGKISPFSLHLIVRLAARDGARRKSQPMPSSTLPNTLIKFNER